MEAKKNTGADLNRKSSFFFSIALLITMSLVLFAFEFRQHETPIDELVQRNTDVFENEVVPITEIIPPAPPQVAAPIIVEVPDEEEIEQEIEFVINLEKESEASVAPVIVVVNDEPEARDEIVLFPEQSASPRGGFEAFYAYLSANILRLQDDPPRREKYLLSSL